MKTAVKSTMKTSPVKSGADVKKKVDKFMSDGEKKMDAKRAAAKKNFQKGAEDFKDKVGDGLNRLGENISGAGMRLRTGK